MQGLQGAIGYITIVWVVRLVLSVVALHRHLLYQDHRWGAHPETVKPSVLWWLGSLVQWLLIRNLRLREVQDKDRLF